MTDLGSDYCPQCGEPVASASEIRATDGEPLPPEAVGVFAEQDEGDAHAEIGQRGVRVYVHGEDGEVMTDGGQPGLPAVIDDVLDDAGADGLNRQVLIERVAEISGATLDEVEEVLGGEVRRGAVIVTDGLVKRVPNRRLVGQGGRP